MAQRPNQPPRPPTPFRTQPQGGPPPQASNGTEPVPAVHAWPGQRVDPRTFVGPNPMLADSGLVPHDASGPTEQQLTTQQGLTYPTFEAPTLPVPQTGLGGIALRKPMTEPPAVLGTRKNPLFGITRLDNYFLSRLPASGLTFWHRKHIVNGATVMAAPSTVYSLPIYTLPQGLSLIVMYFMQNWYDASLDPLDPDALTSFQSNQDAYGRVGINLLVNNAPVFDANETLFDPNSGANTTRRVSGFTLLDKNLLEIGAHPTAIYARDNATLTAKFTMSDTLPSHIPSAVGVEMNGYTLPTKEFQELMISVRQQR